MTAPSVKPMPEPVEGKINETPSPETIYDGLTLLGQSGSPSQKKLEVFKKPGQVHYVKFLVEEFTSVCPMTGQPDYGTIEIEYAPYETCLESKSLKLYMQTFRNAGIFWEALAEEIAREVGRVLQPLWIQVNANQKARGGISLQATCRYDRDSSFGWTFTEEASKWGAKN